MAKQSMIQREKKRERLIVKYSNKREVLKAELKSVGSFQERLAMYKKWRRFRETQPLRVIEIVVG